MSICCQLTSELAETFLAQRIIYSTIFNNILQYSLVLLMPGCYAESVLKLSIKEAYEKKADVAVNCPDRFPGGCSIHIVYAWHCAVTLTELNDFTYSSRAY